MSLKMRKEIWKRKHYHKKIMARNNEALHNRDVQMKWIRVADNEPPKDLPILATDGQDTNVVVWSQKGWWVFNSTDCSCCSGFCSFKATHWMPIPELPRINPSYGQN